MQSARRPRGFTLVEMLVVVIIIGILAAILVPAVSRAIRKAQLARIGIEINQLHNAVEAYKQKYTDYPPDGSNPSIVSRHVRKAFPKISSTEFTFIMTVFTTAPPDPAEALVFWLGGFSADPQHPFTGPGGPFVQVAPGIFALNATRNDPLYPFDDERLTVYKADLANANQPSAAGALISSDEYMLHTSNYADNDLFPVYFPKDRGEPYVYFDARSYRGATQPVALPAPRYPRGSSNLQGFAAPYLSATATQTFANQTTFQIVSASLDGDYGAVADNNGDGQLDGGVYPTGAGYGDGDRDNVTNFSEGRALEDQIP